MELFELVRTYSHSSKVGKSGKIIFDGPFVSIRPLLSLLSLYVFFVSPSSGSRDFEPASGVANGADHRRPLRAASCNKRVRVCRFAPSSNQQRAAANPKSAIANPNFLTARPARTPAPDWCLCQRTTSNLQHSTTPPNTPLRRASDFELFFPAKNPRTE